MAPNLLHGGGHAINRKSAHRGAGRLIGARAGMDKLIEGYRRFRTGAWRLGRDLYLKLAEGGQNPRSMMIACSDSRIDPQLIFDAAPGEMFVVRNVANLVPPYSPNEDYHGTSAALEFAVTQLHVKNIVVMGHAGCGGVASLLKRETAPSDFVGTWMRIAAPALERALACCGDDPARLQTACEYAAVEVCLDNLMTFPWVRERVEQDALRLVGCHFDIATGELVFLRGGPDDLPRVQIGGTAGSTTPPVAGPAF